jgi:hypothetical protein
VPKIAARILLIQDLRCFHELPCICFRQFPPPHFTGRIHQKLRGASDVAAVPSAAGEKQIVAPDGFRIAIGKQRKSQAGFLS